MGISKDILIADAGGTSTRWCLLSKQGYLMRDLYASPINACTQSDLELRMAFQYINVLFDYADEVYFYGAGCNSETECKRITEQFRDAGYKGELFVASDMLGAARSLFGDEPGIAAILGTGSNSCLYNGESVVENVPPLGFILGDEGSGASIGKRFLKHLLRKDLSEELLDEFLKENRLELSDIFTKIYREPKPNKFLASCTPFIRKHIDDNQVRAIVQEEFDDFFGNIISRYPDTSVYPISCVGSVAYYFNEVLRASASRHSMIVNRIERDPMAGLLKYHYPAYNPR